MLTAQEDGTRRLLDDQLLDRATELDRVLFTEDDDLLAEAASRQIRGESFAGVIFIRHRLLLHYGIYRRYPLRPWPAFKNAWRIAFR